MGRVLALDVGDARIGLAISDPTGVLASPLDAYHRRDPHADAQAIAEVGRREGAVRILAGVPLSLDGRRGPQARKVLAFVRLLKATSELPVILWDERFSTVEASQRIRNAGGAPSRDRARLDSASAAVILQAYLDREAFRSREG